MLTKEITLEDTENQVRKVVCSICNTRTNHKVHTIVKLYWDDQSYGAQGSQCYETISCLGCEEISFRILSSSSEDFSQDEEGNYFATETESIYPNRLAGRPSLQEAYSLPDKIKNIYNETHSALTSKLKILAGVGIRALIEAICLEEKAKGSNLEKKINNLVEKGVLTTSSSLTLHKTRFLGNRSAHEIEAATDIELEVAFDIVENLLKTVYIIPRKAKNLSLPRERHI